MTRCKPENLCVFRLIKGAALLKFWKFFSSKAMFCVPTCASGSLPALQPQAHDQLAVQHPGSRLSRSLSDSQTLSSSNVGIPAVRPNNKGCAPCLWTITSSTCPYMVLCIAEAHKKGVCLLACVTALEQACWSNCLTKGCGTKKIRREKVCLVVCNVWNICMVCQCSRGRTVSEDRWRVRVTVCPYGSCQLNSFFQPREKRGKNNQLAKLIRDSWMRICNWDQCWRTWQDL